MTQPLAARPVPGTVGLPLLGPILQSGAFMRDWHGFLDRRRREHGATVFRMGLGGPVVACIDQEALDHLADPADFDRLYGFGPRRPLPWVLDGHVPLVFRNDDSHATLKTLHGAVYAARAEALDEALDTHVEPALARWRRLRVFDLGAAIDELVAKVLCAWLFDAQPPPGVLETVGRGIIPLRLHDRKQSNDAAVRAAFLALAEFIECCPAAREWGDIAIGHGITPHELARDLAFTVPMNAWGAVSGALLSGVAELDRHPVHREPVARDTGSRARFVAEVMRLHPPAPVTFGRARRDLELRASTGRFSLRAGETVVAVIAMVHRDPRFFPDPATFRPERFEDRAALAALRWAAASPDASPGADARACPGGHEAMRIVGRILARVAAEGRWTLAEPPEWTSRLVPRNVPDAAVVVQSFGRDAQAAATVPTVGSAADDRKVRMLAALRRFQRRSVEVWSRRSYRTRHAAQVGLPPLVPARDHYATPEIPGGLMVPATLPTEGRMGLAYMLPYYVLAGVFFMFLRRRPVSGHARWTAGHPWLSAFDYPSPWGNLQDDASFVALRTAGPNPFLLRADGEGWSLDYAPIFVGITEPLACRFELHDGALVPSAITLGSKAVRPDDPGWRRAKRLANALEARASIFVQHLGLTHLVVGQAISLSRFELPPGHAVRALLDLHAFATLEVNDWAYKLLVSPTSYFIRSGFLSRDEAFRMFTNVVGSAGIDHLFPGVDIPARGLDRLPGHAYAEEAPGAFAVLRRYVDSAIGGVDDVRADADLARWHARLRALVPRFPDRFAHVDTREALVELLTGLVYNNVAHEVVGDFSPYFAANDAESLGILDLRALVDGIEQPPSLRSVLLMKQGAWSARFQLAANAIVEVQPSAATPSPMLQTALLALQVELRRLSAEVQARNERRAFPIRGMDPRAWKLSIGI